MIDGWDVYWVSRLDAIRDLFQSILCVACALAGLGAIFWFMTLDGEEHVPKGVRTATRRAMWIGVPVALFFGILFTATPTTKEAIAIKVIPAVANSADVQGLGSDVVQLARDWLNELRPKVVR